MLRLVVDQWICWTTSQPATLVEDIVSAVEEREERLQALQKDHPGATLADIKHFADVYTRDCRKWLRGDLLSQSVMSVRIEEVLWGLRPLKKKPPKSRDE